MRILFLAPQPFFVERGTPIAVKLALQVLGARGNPPGSAVQVELLTYHEGTSLPLTSVTHYRSWAPGFLRNVGPGLSWKKLVCDLFFLCAALKLVWQARGKQYSVVHAVEEAVFIGLLIKLLFGIPFIYDMDSNMAGQIVEKWECVRFLHPLLCWIERLAVRQSLAVVPVCDSLAEIAYHYGSRHVSVLRDVSLLRDGIKGPPIDLRTEAGLHAEDKIVVYIGNLERYQGIDLLLESFVLCAPQCPDSHLVIVGGGKSQIEVYKDKAARLGLASRCHFLGPKPLQSLPSFISQADVLVSPRIKGENTPMKIYSYLHSGSAILATRLRTHTQVLNDSVAVLRAPAPQDFAEGLTCLLSDVELRKRVGAAARELAEREFTFDAFSKQLNKTYDDLLGAIFVTSL